jgi:hypothetical protein
MGYVEDALQRTCPTCGQPPGKRCKRKMSRPGYASRWNPTPARRKGTLMPAPHPERTFAHRVDPLAIDRPKLAAWLREFGHILTDPPETPSEIPPGDPR